MRQKSNSKLLSHILFSLTVYYTLSRPAQAKILVDGIWSQTADFWHEDPESGVEIYSVSNGVVNYFGEGVNSSQLTHPQGNIYEQPNVQRVASIFTQEDWEYIFPYRLPGYDYEFFLEAVALYPAFCNEFKLFYSEPEAGYFYNLSSQDQACRRELATLLAHIVQKTGSTDDAAPEFGGLQVTTTLCDVFGFLAPSLCELNEDSSPYGQLYYGRPGRQYYQRGPIHLTWNGRYGQLS